MRFIVTDGAGVILLVGSATKAATAALQAQPGQLAWAVEGDDPLDGLAVDVAAGALIGREGDLPALTLIVLSG